mmetsp:Transcript_33749/g.89011  ORF Transcript_33749/g.89011 Transcript_33749/m.89011 type:complete len:201 (+) Transcript_33749:1272-1874(+)
MRPKSLLDVPNAQLLLFVPLLTHVAHHSLELGRGGILCALLVSNCLPREFGLDTRRPYECPSGAHDLHLLLELHLVLQRFQHGRVLCTKSVFHHLKAPVELALLLLNHVLHHVELALVRFHNSVRRLGVQDALICDGGVHDLQVRVVSLEHVVPRARVKFLHPLESFDKFELLLRSVVFHGSVKLKVQLLKMLDTAAHEL